MKKFCCWILIALMLLSAAACAQAPVLSENMFKYTKAALAALAAGAYEKVVANLPFSGVSPSAKEWRSLAEAGFSALTGSNPQSEYAVAWWNGRMWKIAVPVAAPAKDDVESLVLFSADGETFTGYSCEIWGSVMRDVQEADYVSWNEEYNASTSALVEFDEN